MRRAHVPPLVSAVLNLASERGTCQLDTVFSVGALTGPFITAEPKGAYSTTVEVFLVLTCACAP